MSGYTCGTSRRQPCGTERRGAYCTGPGANENPQIPQDTLLAMEPQHPRGDRQTECPERFVQREIVITEKLDGASTLLHQGLAHPRSAGAPSQAPWLGMVRKHHAWKVTDPSAFLYGEDIQAVHSIRYAPIPEDRTFHAFALLQDGRFASWDELDEFAQGLRIPTAPLLFRGAFASIRELNGFIQAAHHGKGALGPLREGVVIRTAGSFPSREFDRNVCKSVRAGHVQTLEHWRRNWETCQLLPAAGGE